MKVAFVSDIHGNLPAWRAVLNDMEQLGVERVVCLGDIVGYGPRSVETLKAVRDVCDGILIGNHEAAAAGLLDLSIFNDHARDMICWTADKLGVEKQIEIARFPYTLEVDAGGYPALCVHSDARDPREFGYILDEQDAGACLAACTHRLVLLGHTHIPRADVMGPGGAVASLTPDRVVFKSRRRYVLNIGSVGMSRDGDPRACYGVLNTSAQSFTWRRVAYDLGALRADIETGPWPADRAARMCESFAHLWAGEDVNREELSRTLVMREAQAWHLNAHDPRRDYGHHTHRRTLVWSLLAFVLMSAGLGVALYRNQQERGAPIRPLVVVATPPSVPALLQDPLTRSPEPLPPPAPRPEPPRPTPPSRPEPPPVVAARPEPPRPVAPVPVRPAVSTPRPAATGNTWYAALGTSETSLFQWDDAQSWQQAGFPNRAGAVAVLDIARTGIRTLNVQSGCDVTVGTIQAMEASNCTIIWKKGHRIIFDNGASPAQWIRHKGQPRLGALRLTVNTDVHLISTLEATWSVQRGIEVNNRITGPGALVIHHFSNDGPDMNRQVVFRGEPNEYEGGTTLNGRNNAQRPSLFVAEKSRAFGKGDVTVNEFARLILAARGPAADMIADTAALRLTRTDKGGTVVELRAGVQETVGALFFNLVPQAPGTWGSGASSAQHKNDEFFAGPGVLTVLPAKRN